jgi:hypothetical protein
MSAGDTLGMPATLQLGQKLVDPVNPEVPPPAFAAHGRMT